MPTDSANLMVFQWLSIHDPSAGTLFWLSALAQWPLYGLPLLLVGVWLCGARADRDATVAAGVTCSIALLAAHVVSTCIDHPRPFMLGLAGNVLNHAPDSSFPSDHATLLFAAAAAFAFRPAPQLRWLGAVLALTGLASGWARVALGVHFPLDVVGAATIAGLSECLVASHPMCRPLIVLTRISEAIRDRVPLLPDRGRGSLRAMARSDARPAR